jgi:hypothetical protein
MLTIDKESLLKAKISSLETKVNNLEGIILRIAKDFYKEDCDLPNGIKEDLVTMAIRRNFNLKSTK